MPSILVVAPNWIGDALMAQPLFERLHDKIAGLRLDVLAPEWVAPVLRRMPQVNAVIAGSFRHGALQLRERWRLGRALRANGYQQAIVLPNSWKSGLVPYFADIPLRSGYVGERATGLLNLLYRADRSVRELMTEYYARLAEAPGTEPALPLPQARLKVDPGAADATARRFGLAPERGPIVLLCPGAEYGPAKRWPAERFGLLAREMAALGCQVALLGSAKDAPVCDEVARESQAALDLAGRTTLDEAIELIAGAALVVTNDSGLMHVAAALERPQVALFGSSSPAHTPPDSARASVIWLGIECSPCYRKVCPLGHFRCMQDIAVQRVLSEARALAMIRRHGEQDLPTPQDAEAAFYEALEQADLEGMMAVWAEDEEEIVCVHPGGPRLTGHDQVRASWREIFAGGPQLRVKTEYQVRLSATMLSVHSVHEVLSVRGEPRPRGPVVATNVYMRTAAGWRMIVHHASPAPGRIEAPAPQADPKVLH